MPIGALFCFYLKNNSLASIAFQRIFKNILKKVGKIFGLSNYIIVYLHYK